MDRQRQKQFLMVLTISTIAPTALIALHTILVLDTGWPLLLEVVACIVSSFIYYVRTSRTKRHKHFYRKSCLLNAAEKHSDGPVWRYRSFRCK
jgi:hypothetical protein